MNPTFEAFLDTVRTPVFVLVIIAAIWIDIADRSYFEQLFAASPSAPVAAQAAPAGANALAIQTATTSLSQPAATITVDDQSTLPTSVTTGQIVSFSFTLRNTGSIAATFPYKVYVDWNTGEEDVIDENVITIPAGQSQTIPEELKFEQASDKGEIFIKIQNTGQSVQFALPA